MSHPYSGLRTSQARNLRKTGRKQTNSRHDQDNQRGPEKGPICGGVGKNVESSKGVVRREWRNMGEKS